MEKKALSNYDIQRLFDHKVKIIRYVELNNFTRIEDVFGSYDIVFLLYEQDDYFGHWVVLCWKRKENTIIFFDPYGMFPDDQMSYSSAEHNGKTPILTKFLIKYKGKVEYNKYQLQDIKNPDIATCGRWCALYALLYNDIPLDEFADIFLSSDLYPDKIVSLLTHYA